MPEEYITSVRSIPENEKRKAKKVIKIHDGIPYVCYEIKGKDIVTLGEVDPKHRPKISSEAVLGDIRKQIPFCIYHHKPKFCYQDINFKCKCCGDEAVFLAKEQKYWYEELRFHPHSFPKECTGCRKKIREGKIRKVTKETYKVRTMKPKNKKA